METCPKIASTRLPVEGCRPPRLAIETNKRPTGGLIAPMALLALILFGVAPLFTLPSVSHRDLVRLVRAFLQAPLGASVPRDHCLMIAFDRLLALTPRGCQGRTSANSAAARKAELAEKFLQRRARIQPCRKAIGERRL
jgi:hypothetical protein